MIALPAGDFAMGAEFGHEDELPVHQVHIESFYLDRHEVTNQQFAEFVETTGYLTRAEEDGGCWGYILGAEDFDFLEGADWRHPQGTNSDIEVRLDHPVVCVGWADANAYAHWAGKRLPTEAEWEYASRAGGQAHAIAATGHGHEPTHETVVPANVWQGTWPDENRMDDGYFYTAPVGSFEPNAAGLVDMLGNVWEWTADWYSADAYAHARSLTPASPQSGQTRVARGGSWFCSANYCGAYNTHFRGASPPDHAFNNVGFRCAADVESSPASEEAR
jgi:formylglycine-generating enzyme required for sulfatase activity